MSIVTSGLASVTPTARPSVRPFLKKRAFTIESQINVKMDIDLVTDLAEFIEANMTYDETGKANNVVLFELGRRLNGIVENE